MVSTGQWIREQREARGLTRQRVIEMLGYESPQTLYWYETGRRQVSPEFLVRFCRLVGCDLLQALRHFVSDIAGETFSKDQKLFSYMPSLPVPLLPESDLGATATMYWPPIILQKRVSSSAQNVRVVPAAITTVQRDAHRSLGGKGYRGLLSLLLLAALESAPQRHPKWEQALWSSVRQDIAVIGASIAVPDTEICLMTRPRNGYMSPIEAGIVTIIDTAQERSVWTVDSRLNLPDSHALVRALFSVQLEKLGIRPWKELRRTLAATAVVFLSPDGATEEIGLDFYGREAATNEHYPLDACLSKHMLGPDETREFLRLLQKHTGLSAGIV